MHYTKIKNKYYKITKITKKKVSKKVYYSYIKRKLRRSIYPTQYKDFVFLKIPKHFYQTNDMFKNKNNKYVPCDYLLKNIILKLWENNIQTYGWDQSYPEANKSRGFINFQPSELNKEKIFNLFGKEIFSNKRFKTKLFFENYGNFMSITFHHNLIPWMNYKLNVESPTYEESYPGNLIEFKDYDYGKRLYFSSNKYKKLII
jgi:hypothetical protein